MNGCKQPLNLSKETRDWLQGNGELTLFEFFKALASVWVTALLENKVQFMDFWLSSISCTEPMSPSSLYPTSYLDVCCSVCTWSFHFLVLLTLRHTHNTLLTGFPNLKLVLFFNKCVLSFQYLSKSTVQNLQWSVTFLLQVSCICSIQESLEGLFRKEYRIMGVTLELLNLNLNFNKAPDDLYAY